MTNDRTDNKALTVYKAGAGSGKTFTLSSEYIKKVIINPTSYRNILAVTFTNKATGEMKMRILSQLYGIWKLLPDSKQYVQKVAIDLSMSEKQVAKMSGEALRHILHDYNHFRIETIDTFFQSILRNIARELDLTANLRIDLNDSQIEADAVDLMIENLQDKTQILDWILHYIDNNLQEEKSWNVIGEIKRFGQNIFKDQYKAHYEDFEKASSTPDFFLSYIRSIHAIRQKALNDIKEKGRAFFDEAQRAGLESTDFSRKDSGVWGYFAKLRDGIFDDKTPNETVKKALDDPNAWITAENRKTERGKMILDLVESKLHSLLCEAEKVRSAAMKSFVSADITLKNVYQLSLLNSIEHVVRQMNADANRFLLSDTPSLLHALIKDNDAPFIFEKIGTQLDYIMIDEFQDTGIMQWKNFKVLLEECMSRSKEGNLIVGDVKQSIYRWRSGDWRLLNNITSEFANHEARVATKSLKFNYRSKRNIIDFNNTLFRLAAEQEAFTLQKETKDESYSEQLRRAYADVCQEIPSERKREGFVSVNLLPTKDYRENTFELIKTTIKQLIANGVEMKNIAILARRNGDIEDIADYFSKQKDSFPLVSNEAFRLDSSVAVNIIVCALRLMSHPEDNISRALMVKLYHKHILNHAELTDNEILVDKQTGRFALPKEFETNIETIKRKPLYNIVKELFNIFELDKLNDENAYISMFYDELVGFTADNPADIESFLSEWDNTIHAKTIHANDVNGIQIMTIHKCKGLEFDNVIVPFCDWQIDTSSLIWCSPQEKPYSLLPVLPINYNFTRLKGSIYKDDADMEYFQKRVDSLNLLYVVFTRAAHNLFVIGKRSNKGLCSNLIEKVMPDVCQQTGMELLSGMYEDQNTALSYSYGNLFVPKEKVEKTTMNLSLQRAIPMKTTIHTYNNTADFVQSNESRSFIEGEEESERASFIKKGNVLHRLFSSIYTADDIEESIKKLEFDGLIHDCGMSHEGLLKFVNVRVRSSKASEWFSKKWQLFNECSILTRDFDTGLAAKYRPDRVMTDGDRVVIVDFKFGHQRPEYQQQVLHYMALIKEMGYKNVSGYLWYVYSNEIKEVYE